MIKLLWPYLKHIRAQRKVFVLGTLCSIIYAASSGLGIPTMIQTVFRDAFEQRSDTESISQVLVAGGLLLGVFLLRSVFGFIGGYLLSLVGLRIAFCIRQELFDKIQSLPLAYFDNSKTGDILTKISSDASAVQSMLIEVSSVFIKQPFTFLAAAGLLVYQSLQYNEIVYLLLFFLAAPILIIPVQLIGRKLKKRGRETQDSNAEIMQHLNENLDALQEIRSFNLQASQKHDFSERMEENLRLNLKLRKYELSQQPSMEVIVVIVVVAVFIFAFTKGIEFDTFAMLAALLYFTFDPLKRIMKAINLIQKTKGSINRVDEILSIPLTLKEPENPVLFETVKGDIHFENITFAYDSEPVLSDINVKLDAGQTIALVGPSGAGKSTFAKLIPRFYDPTEGSLKIDGVDIRDVSSDQLRSQIAIVPQAPVLFDYSIRENIRIGDPGASDEQIEEAAKSAYAHDFIIQFPEGYDTVCGERGDRLSGGQKQRIALARAFLKNAPILILDEATSSLDSESEAHIQKAIVELQKNRTTIMIAHRLSTFQNADRVVFFEQGKIVATGTHPELLENCPRYSEFLTSQKSRTNT